MIKNLCFIFIILGAGFGLASDDKKELTEDEKERERILKLYGKKEVVKKITFPELKKENSNLVNQIEFEKSKIQDKMSLIREDVIAMSDNGDELSDMQKAIIEKQIQVRTIGLQKTLDKTNFMLKAYLKDSVSDSKDVLNSLKSKLKFHLEEMKKSLEASDKTQFVNEDGQLDQKGLISAIESTLGGEDVVEDSFISGIMSKKMKETAKQMIKENPFSLMSKLELKQVFLNKTKGTAAGKYLRKNERVLRTLVEVCHDKRAIPEFISLINKPDKMKKYGFCFIGVFIIAFIINMLNAKRSLLRRFMVKFCIMWVAALINCTTFYFIFEKELKPGIEAVKRVW